METNLSRLRHIVAVARTASFSLAADEEGISQPALSRSIQAFERRHGVRLFDRGRSGVSLTAAGVLVVDQARSLLGAAAELDRSLRLYGKGEAGRIGIGLGPLMASMLLPSLAASLLQSRPHLQIVSMVRQPEQMLESLLNDSIEIIIGNNWQLADAPGTELEPIGSLALVHVARGPHPLSRQERICIADLANFPVAGAFDLQIKGVTPIGGAFICENFSILKEVVERTDCVWFTSPAYLRGELATGHFRVLDVVDHETASTEICIVRRRGRSRSPASLAVAKEVRDLLASLNG